MITNSVEHLPIYQIREEKKTSNIKSSFTDEQIEKVLTILNQEYQHIESQSPAEGYQVEIETNQVLKGKLISEGNRRSVKNLIGLPEDEEQYKKGCPFCPASLKTDRILKEWNDSIAVLSNRNQYLVVSKTHYAHWFVTPISEQVQLIQNAILLREQHSNLVNGPIVLHCGTVGKQSIFHLHVRTNIHSK